MVQISKYFFGGKMSVFNGDEVGSGESKSAQNKKKGIGCLGVAGIIILGLFLIGSFANGKASEVSSPEASPSSGGNKSSYCLVIRQYVNDAVRVMGNAGSTSTLDDVVSVLKDSGTKLSTGFDSEMAGSQKMFTAISDAGSQLLRIRVALLDGGDVKRPSVAFQKDYAVIMSNCPKDF
jgi:hypothetical protein